MIAWRRADCRDGLAGLPPGVVDLVVTSPPYGSRIRTYGPRDPTLDFTDDVFREVATQLVRVLAVGGVICWQEGDWMYKGSWVGLTYQHLLWFKTLGLRHYDTVYSGICGGGNEPSHWDNPPTPVWVLSRGRPKTLVPLRKRNRSSGSGKRHARNPDGSHRVRPRKTIKAIGARTAWWYYPAYGHTEYPYHALPFGATMHQGLCRDLISAYSRPGDLVCDPFGGLATTAKWSCLLGRSAVSWEVRERWWRHGCRRLSAARRQRLAALQDR